jgi:hypothetical protein
MSERKISIPTWLRSMMCAAASGCISEVVALPFDTLKTTLMVDSKSRVTFQAIRIALNNLHRDGWEYFFKGLSPGLHRQLVFASIRIGLYEPVSCAVYSAVDCAALLPSTGAIYEFPFQARNKYGHGLLRDCMCESVRSRQNSHAGTASQRQLQRVYRLLQDDSSLRGVRPETWDRG